MKKPGKKPTKPFTPMSPKGGSATAMDMPPVTKIRKKKSPKKA
jgi:hypothetical protein